MLTIVGAYTKSWGNNRERLLAHLQDAFDILDQEFGEGFARKHPELVVELTKAAMADEDASQISQKISEATDALWLISNSIRDREDRADD